MTRAAAAYLRRSRSDDPAREVSRAVQENAVRDLARHDGLDPDTLQTYVDWDRSGDDAKVERRAEYQSLLTAIKAGEVGTVYAYSADRLYRGMTTYVALMAAAQQAHVRLVTARDGVIGGDGSPMANAYAQIGAVFAELELNTAKSRAKAAAAQRRRRGDHMGSVPYGYRLAHRDDGVVQLAPNPDEPVAMVLDAWERSGRQVRRCVRIVNDELRLPAKRGGQWDRPSLLRLIQREAPDRLPRRAPGGRREESASLTRLAKLLACHCGRTLTPNIRRERRKSRGNAVQVNYYCARGMASRADHRRVYVAEAVLLPWVQAEADRLRMPMGQVVQAEQDADKRAALEAKRARIAEMYIEALIDRTEQARRVAAIDAEVEQLDARRRAVLVPQAIDWTWPPKVLNDVLRNLWRAVQLDDDMRPLRAEWTVPEWRAA